MRRKASKVSRVRLSPNEEAQLVREELDRRRKLRLQQVREQERCIAQQVRREVRERRETQLRILADTLQHEWQQQRTDKLHNLARVYEDSLRSVGHGHRGARENEPDLEALAQKSMERRERAADRHREALRELTARRHEEEQQRCRHVEARRKALLEERKRASRVAGLPPPPPNPLEFIGMKTRPPLKATAAERFSVTHHHMPETAVDRETDTQQQMDARQAAEVELQRLGELEQVEARDREEKMEKARLRGNHALRKEQHTQDRARLLDELESLQRADLLRRRQTVNSIPAQIFQPLYRQEELRDEQQRDLEIAFQDMYTQERKVRGDLVLQLVPEPLPNSSSASHDEDLDVTLDPESTPEVEEPDSSDAIASSVPTRDPGRQALRRLLDRIRTQRDQGRQRQTTVAASNDGDTVTDVLSIETGSLSSQEREQAGSVEEKTPSVTQSEEVPEASDEPIVAGTVLLPEDQARVMPTSAETERRAHLPQQTDEGPLLRQQQEQLFLLEELEEKRRELEKRLKDAQQERRLLEEAAPRHSGIEEVRTLPGDTHTQRLHQYQQRLLEQNRLHKKCVEDARRRLEEYQHTLKLRNAIGNATAAQTLQPSSVTPETVCLSHPPTSRRPDLQSAPPLTRNSHPAVIIGPEEQPERDACWTPSAPAQPPLFSPPKPVGSGFINTPVLQSGGGASVRHSEDHRKSHDAAVEDQPGVCVSEQVPLPPPSVVLELLRSRLHHSACAAVQPAEVSGSVGQRSDPACAVHTSQPAALQLQSESEQEQPSAQEVRRHMGGQTDALQALLRTDMQGGETSSSGLHTEQLTLMNTLLKAIEGSREHMKAPAAPTATSLPPSSEHVYEQTAGTRGKVKPPVSRLAARLAFLQQMEQHELSAIQEVDTPVNVSLDAELSESSSVSLPAVISDGSPSERSQVTGRISRMSWRETLLIDSAASQRSASSINQHPEHFGVDVAPGQSSVDRDLLSSTTISTGSYCTSDHEPSDITEASLLRIEPVGMESSVSGPSLKSSSCPVTGNQSQEMRDSIQQIIDKYTKDLDASLRTGSVHTVGNTSSVSQSWSSVLQQDVSHDEDISSLNSAVDLSNTELTGAFLPLQAHPDIDSSSSSSSSSRNLLKNDQSSRTQGWNETVNRILERFSDQLSIRRSNQARRSTLNQLTEEPSNQSTSTWKDREQASNFSHLIGRLTDDSSQTSSVISLRQNSIGPHSSVSEVSHCSTSYQVDKSIADRLPDESLSRGQFEGCESILIAKISDIDSSQVLDESSALAVGLGETLQQTRMTAAVVTSSVGGAGGSERACDVGPSVHLSAPEIISPAFQHSEEDRNVFTEAPHEDTSGDFLSLPTEVTHNESVECSVAARMPLEAEMCQTNRSTCTLHTSASDWLEPTDSLLPSFSLDASLSHLRADTLTQSKSDLQISVDQLSLTHESLSETDTVAPPTATDVSLMPCSPSEVCLQDESHTLEPQLPSQDMGSVSTEMSQHQSTVEENMLARFWKSDQVGNVKGILEESTISFISSQESTLQDPDITGAEDHTDRPAEAETGNKAARENETRRESDHSEDKASTVEGSSQHPELSSPHAVMLLEFQSPSAQQQEALLRRRHHLAQRSARRAAEVKTKRAETGKMTRVPQNVSKPSSSPGCTIQKSEMVCRLKTVGEVKICTPEQRCLEEAEMYQRTQRLYSQLEEVKQRKELNSRQKAYAKNREKAQEFQRKTLEKLRAKQKR